MSDELMKSSRYNKIRNTIVIGFFILGLLVIITGSIGIFFVKNVVRVLNDVTDYAAPLVKSTDDLVGNLYESAGLAREIQDTQDSTAVKVIIEEFDENSTQFGQSWEEARNLITDEDLQKKLQIAFTRHQRFTSIAHEMFSQHLNSLEIGCEVALLLEDIDRNRSILLSKLDSLIIEDALKKSTISQGTTGDNVLVLNATRNLQQQIIQLQMIFRDYITEENTSRLTAYEKDYQNLIARGEQLVEFIENQLKNHQIRTRGFRTNWNFWRDLVVGDGGLFSKYRAQSLSEDQEKELIERFDNEIEIAVAALENIALSAQNISNKADERGIVVSAPLTLYGTIFLSIAIICLLGIMIFRFITSSSKQIEHAMEELEGSKEQLSKLAGYLQEVREEERALISHEIHDELGQALTALQIDAALIDRELPDNAVYLHKKVKSMMEIIQSTLANVQKISARLRPAMLDQLGLETAIRWYIEEFIRRTGIACQVEFDCEETITDEKISIALFRILQESLTNIARHAQASQAAIHFIRKRTTVMLAIEDNGRGITDEQIRDSQSFGLLGMKERTKSLHGEFIVHGIKGRGTTVTITIPMNGVTGNDKNTYR